MKDGIKGFFKAFNNTESRITDDKLTLWMGSSIERAFAISLYERVGIHSGTTTLFYLDKEDVDYFITKYTPMIQKELKENIEQLEREYQNLVP